MNDQSDGWSHGAEWEEDRLGADRCSDRAANNLSFPEDGDFYVATKDALPWTPAGRDDLGRVLVPATFVESLFEKAEVENTAEWKDADTEEFRFLTRCLGLKEYMGDALEVLIENGLIHGEDSELRVYGGEDPLTELYRKAAEVVMCVRDEEAMRVTEKSWDWTNAFEEHGAGARLKCAHEITLRALVEKTGDLTLYCDLAKKVGPRGTTEGRNDSSFCLAVLGESGMLFGAIKKFYGHDETVTDVGPDLWRARVPDFLQDSKLPKVYRQEYASWRDYMFTLGKQASWRTATRAEWAKLVEPVLSLALDREFPTLAELFQDLKADPVRLVKEPWIAYARLLAPPRSNPGHCLAKSGRRSLIAYKAIAFKV